MSTTDSRFTVDDSVCGLLEYFSRFRPARDFAIRSRADYTSLTIYDRMASKGAPQSWTWDEAKQDFVCSKYRPLVDA